MQPRHAGYNTQHDALHTPARPPRRTACFARLPPRWLLCLRAAAPLALAQVEAQGSCARTSVLAIALPYHLVHLVRSSTLPLRALPSFAPSECSDIDHRVLLAPWALLPGRCPERAMRKLLSRLHPPGLHARAAEHGPPEALLARYGLRVWTPSTRVSYRIVYRPYKGRRARDGTAALARAVIIEFIACHPQLRQPGTAPPTTTDEFENVAWCAHMLASPARRCSVGRRTIVGRTRMQAARHAERGP